MALLLGLAISQPVQAQILIMDLEEETGSDHEGTEGGWLDMPNIPGLGMTMDQYAPLGGEVLVLAALGGAYLMGKRRKKED